MSPSYTDALAQARRLFAVLLILLAKDDNSDLNAIKSMLLNEIKNSKVSTPKELGSLIRAILMMTINNVYQNHGITLEVVESLVSEIKKRKTMRGTLS